MIRVATFISDLVARRLRRLLRGLGWLYPDLGYCQGVGVVAAVLLLLLEEEDAFWLLCTTVEDLLPASYYTSSLIGTKRMFWLGLKITRRNESSKNEKKTQKFFCFRFFFRFSILAIVCMNDPHIYFLFISYRYVDRLFKR